MKIFEKYRKYWHITVSATIVAQKLTKFWRNMRKIQVNQQKISKSFEYIAKNKGLVLSQEQIIRLED